MTDISVTAPDGGRFSAYLAAPPSGRAPGIVLIQEIFGVNANMRAIADGFAAQGYATLCPDLFWRQEPGVQLTDKTEAEWQKAFQLYQGFDQDKGVGDLAAALAALRIHPSCTGKAGTVGFCLGGKLAFLMATRSDAECNVSYYGVGIENALDEAGRISRPLMLHIAEADQFVPKEAQDAIEKGVADNPRVTVHRYAGADHAFAREGGQHYDKGAADLANTRTAKFFATHLR